MEEKEEIRVDPRSSAVSDEELEARLETQLESYQAQELFQATLHLTFWDNGEITLKWEALG
jgi:hypothetical protein